MKIYGIYTSVWAEGEVHTKAGICTERKAITETEVSDDGEHYEHHERDFVQVEHNNKFYELECEDGDLTAEGVKQLEAFLAEVMIPAVQRGPVTDLDLVMVEVTTEAFEQIENEFDTFTRSDVSNEIILDASSFDEDVIEDIAKTLRVSTDDISGHYVLMYHEGREWSEIRK